MRTASKLLTLLFLAVGLHSASAFSLLGPFEPWMTTNLGFNNPFVGTVDIGGPKNFGEGYRWNVPVITYGFDESFLNYFGSNGVAAVESAIQVFNDLPPASATNMNGYLTDTRRVNYTADQQSLYDLKSAAMGLIIEQLGLASPSRFVFTLRNYGGEFNSTVLMLSFDPAALAPSPYVNGDFYNYEVAYYPYLAQSSFCVTHPADPEQYPTSFDAVADFTYFPNYFNVTGLSPYYYYTGLTRDDVGGLSYLYGTNNFAPENLIPGVHGVGRHARDYVNLAVRPGVGKVTFQRLAYDERRDKFRPKTIRYVDYYLTNNAIQHQILEREIKQPDILFTSAHLGFDEYSRTGTSNWVNNGAPSQGGPGVIQPPVTINFGPLTSFSEHVGTGYSSPSNFYFEPQRWGSFDGTTNAPIVYPTDSIKNNSSLVYFNLGRLLQSIYGTPFYYAPPPFETTWPLTGEHGKVFLLQTSTNLSDWVTITTVTNNGQDLSYSDQVLPGTPQRFYRVSPQ
jgi:hypothetical protein